MKKMNQRLTAMIAFSLFTASAVQASEFAVTSPDLEAGGTIAADQYWNQFGCSGANKRPALKWTDPPAGTKSFAVTFYDKDAPTGSGFWHWVVYDIPASTRELTATGLPDGSVEGNTDLSKPGYFGPCPPVGRKHQYTFTVHALDADKLDAPKGGSSALTGFFIHQHSIGQAKISVFAGPRDK